MVRYFVYTYAIYENYQITRDNRVFGAPKYGGDHLATKVEKLSPGDIIIIRDGSKDYLRFFPYCAVAGPLYDQDEGSPWPNLLWHDEFQNRRVIYHLRCAVNFADVPQLNLSGLRWESFDTLGFLNDRGRPIMGPQAWAKKLSGNFIEAPKEIAAFHELVGYES